MKNEKLFWIAVSSLAISAGFWIISFYDNPVSKKTGDWSNFGSYLGGVTGPLLSFISIILVLRTIALTQKNHEEQIKLIVQEQTYKKFNDLCEYLEAAIDRSWLKQDSRYFRDLIDKMRTEVIFHERYKDGDVARNYAITFDVAVRILARENKNIDEVALVLESILQHAFSNKTADSLLMKNMLELRLTKQQRLIIFLKLRSDRPRTADQVLENWPSFATPIF